MLSARPVGYIEITPERVRMVPIVDVTRLAVVGMLLAAWNVFWITYTVRAVRGRERRGRRWLGGLVRRA